MASSSVDSTERDTLRKLRNFGRKLLNHLDSDHELLEYLDRLELVLTIVEQNPPNSLKEALVPSMKALISEELLRHQNEDVKISVTACLTEIIRITAPDAPYDDEPMKEILKLIVEALEKLSRVSGRCYEKALTIVRNVSTYRIFLIMLDLYCEDLVVEMFRHFVRIIRSNHPSNVIDSMEEIMTMTLNESEEISPDLLRPLLECVKKENQALSPISWRLGEKVITNCAVMLKPYLMQAVESSGRVLDEYAEIVTSICQNQFESSERNHSLRSNERLVEAVENNLDVTKDAVDEPRVDVTGGQIMDDTNIRSTGAATKEREVTKNSKNSRGSNTKTQLNSETQVDTVPRKRGRKPNSLMNPEEGYDHSWISLRRSAGRSSRSRKARDSSYACPPSREDKMNGTIAKHDQSGKTCNIASDFPSCENPASSEGIVLSNHEHVSQVDEPKSDENVDAASLTNHHILDGSCPRSGRSRKISSTGNKDDHPNSVSMLNKSKVSKDYEVKPHVPIRKITFTVKIGGKALVNPESEVAKMESDFCEEVGKHKSSREEGRSSAQTEDKKRKKQNATPNEGLSKSSDMKGSSTESASKTLSATDENRQTGLKRRRTTVPECQDLGNSLVGKRIKVWWPLDMTYYEGVVYSYDAVKGKHMILYDDDEVELLNLKRERWELVDANVSPDKEQGFGLKKLVDASDMAEKSIKQSETESLKGVKVYSISRSDLADESTEKLASKTLIESLKAKE